MKFQKGDTVKIINAIEKHYIGLVGSVVTGDVQNARYTIQFPNNPDYRYFYEQDLELVEHESETPQKIRTFDTGATRDTVEGKLNYRKALSPIVLRRYVQYLAAHRKQPDGSMRDFDNWKQGIPIEAYFEGLGRHDMATWLLHDGFPAEDNHGSVTLEDSLCAIIFNASGWLHELLKTNVQPSVVPERWEIAHNDPGGHNIYGWFVFKLDVGLHLHKDLRLHSSTGYSGESYGEAPGYWPTEEAAKNALKQYLEK